MVAKYIVSALALAGSALAQCSGDITIRSASDASGIASCVTYSGDVTIDPSVAGTISLSGVRTIDGDLIINNATQLNGFTTDYLATITGTFNLTGLTTLSTLQMDSLTQVNRIYWVTLPALQSLNFARGVSQANQVYISDTYLTSIKGIELSQVGTMDINNNKYLTMINVNSLTNITNTLSFSANGQNLEVQFPNLLAAGNLTFRNVSSISMPSLYQVPGAIGFYSNSFQNFTAENLTRIGSALAFIDCPQVQTLDFPLLNLINGGFILANNSKLQSVDGFPDLQRIGGAIDFRGTFDVITLNNLTEVRGGLTILSSSQNQTLCDSITKRNPNPIRGSSRCSVNQATPETNGTTTGSSSTSKNAAPHPSYDPSAPLTGIFGLIAALLFL